MAADNVNHEADSALLQQSVTLTPLESSLGQPLRIAMVAPCPFPTRQGTQVLIRHLATLLARAGHDVHLIAYGYGEYEADFPFYLHRAARVHAGLRSGPSLLKPAADAALLMTARRVIKAYGCQMVHAHNVEGLGIGALLKLQAPTPVIYHAHNAMGPELPTYFRANLAQAFASVVGDVIDRTLPRTADAVIAFDPDHKSLHEVYGVAEDRLYIIPPGLDPEEIGSPCPERVAALRAGFGEGPILLYAGNPDSYQNLSLLWSAFQIVKRERPEARLLVASSHPPRAFENELKAAPSTDGIILHRFDGLEELRALFAVASVGVSPRSLWTGAPIKVLNYLAAGLPVVATRSGVRHVLSESNACVVDDNPAAFAKGCLEMLKQPHRTREQRRRVLEPFRIETQLPLYEEVYRRVLTAI